MRTRTSNDEQRLSLEDPNFLGKRCGGIGARLPRGYRARGYHASKDKLQIKKSTVN